MGGCERVKVVPALPELTGFVGVGVSLGVLLRVAERLAKSRIVERYEVFRVLSCGWRWSGGCSGPFFTLPRGNRAGRWRWGALYAGAGARAEAGVGAETRCDRSRIEGWRSAIPGAGCWSSVLVRFASCEERSWSTSCRFWFSSERVASVWGTPLSSCETVNSLWTSWERWVITQDSKGMVPASVSVLKSGRSWVVRRRALLA